VVDDGSTDRTAEILTGIAEADPRVRVEVLPRNVGASEARNRGLELVRGTWLTILDADDRFSPGGLEALARAALRGDAAAVIGQQLWTDGRERWISRLYDNPDVRRPGRKSLGTHPGLVCFASPHAKLFHRSCWDGLRFSGRILGDQPWVLGALLRAGDRIDVLGESVYEWHRPTVGDGHGTITTRARSSAQTGAEAAAMARQAFDAVAAESATRLEEAPRNRLLVRYIERLVRYDLVPYVVQALERRDAAAAEVIDAVTSFVEAMPSELIAESAVLGGDALSPALLHWHRLDRPAREAFERLVTATRGANAAVPPRLTDLPRRIAIRIGLGLPRSVGGPIAEALLTAMLVPAWGWRRLRPRTADGVVRR
jgi:Glycosyl transferase family 2